MHSEFTEAMDRFIQHTRLLYPTSTTATHYASDLHQFGQVIDKAPRAIGRQDITHFLTVQCQAGLRAPTLNRRLATLSHFFEYLALEAEEETWANPVVWRLHRLQNGVHLPRDLSEGQVRQLWGRVGQGPVRDQALLALMLDVGLRVGEVVALQVADFFPAVDPGELSSLRVRGKGDKERRVWLVPETAQLLQQALAERGGDPTGPLFLTRRRAGFTVRGVQERVKHYAQQAGLAVEQVSCHRLRHTFARRMAEARMPLPSLSHFLGHNQLQTTQVYIDGADPALRADYAAAMATLSHPAERPPAPAPETVAGETREAGASTVAPIPSPSPLTQAEMQSRLAAVPAEIAAWMVRFLLYQQGRWSPHYQRTRALQWLGELRRWGEWLGQEPGVTTLTALTRTHLHSYLAHLHSQQLSSHTRNHFLNTLWAFLHFAQDHDVPLAPALFRLPRPVRPEGQPRPLSDDEFARLEAQVLATTGPQPTPAALLTRGWFWLLADTGLRIGELETLRVADWDSPTRTLLIRQGKERRDRRLPVSERVAETLDAHLTQREDCRPHQPLLLYQDRPLRAGVVRSQLRRLASQAHVANVTPHRLRHTYATRLLNSGQMPITTLAKLLGHRQLDTTMRYAALYDVTVRTEYAAAMGRVQSRPLPEPDATIWGPTLEASLDPQVLSVRVDAHCLANCM